MAQRERSVRLTNHLRDCFIRAVGADIPKPVKPNTDDVQKALYEQWPKEVQAVYDDEALRGYLKTDWCYLGDGQGKNIVSGGLRYSETAVMATYEEARKKREDALAKLRGVAYGVSTLKALREALPDLVKYMADEAKPVTPGLPVVAGLYDDLKALGLKS